MLRSILACSWKIALSTMILCVIMPGNKVLAQDRSFIDPSEWKFESQRQEMSTVGFIDGTVIFEGKPTLALAGGGKEYSNGHWYTTLNVDPGTYCRFKANFIASNVEELSRSILARIIWQDSKGNRLGTPEYPSNSEAGKIGIWN